MKTLITVLILSAAAFAQGSPKLDIITDLNNKPVVGATVRACAPTASGALGSCLPLAPIFSDKALTAPIANSTVTTDAGGQFGFYAAPGNVVIDTCFSGTCRRYTDYILPTGATAPSVWTPATFVDDGSTDGIIGVFSPLRPITLVRVRVRGNQPWVGCATAPTLTVTIPQTPPSADLVAGTLTVQSAIVSGAGSAKDYVMSAVIPLSASLLSTSEAVLSWTHGVTCSQYPTAVYVSLEFDGAR